MINSINPSVVLTYTIKPNIYGGIAASICKKPYIPNITGLGTAVGRKGGLQKLVLYMYKKGLKNATTVYFQNEKNLSFMKHNRIVRSNYKLIPGSGVVLSKHRYEDYPNHGEEMIFSTIGRIMRDKGTDELIGAARIIKREFPKVTFRLIGDFDEEY